MMVQSETGSEGDGEFPFLYYATQEQDDIFEDSIDTFDEEMDNVDDGIAHSDLDQLEDDSEEEDHPGDDEDHISPFDYNDEFADYDELEE